MVIFRAELERINTVGQNHKSCLILQYKMLTMKIFSTMISVVQEIQLKGDSGRERMCLQWKDGKKHFENCCIDILFIINAVSEHIQLNSLGTCYKFFHRVRKNSGRMNDFQIIHTALPPLLVYVSKLIAFIYLFILMQKVHNYFLSWVCELDCKQQ